MSSTVQFIVTDEQYNDLKIRAEKRGISVSKLVKDIVFPEETSFEHIWQEFLDKLAKFPRDVEFTVATVMGQEAWKNLDKSSKLSIARSFNKKVTSDDKYKKYIKHIGRSEYNVSLYKKY